MMHRARLLSRLCQPSTSLFVRTGCRKADQAAGGQISLCIQVMQMYSNRARKSMLPPCWRRRSNCRAISDTCSRGNAISWRHRWWTSRLSRYSWMQPNDCIFQYTTWVQWNVQPWCCISGNTSATVRHKVSSKSDVVRRDSTHGYSPNA